MDINLQKRNGEMISIGSGIAESGEGYIRFSDGTQICYGYISNAYNGTIIRYPEAFSAAPYITFSYISRYVTDNNMIYSFHVSSGGITDDENFTILSAVALNIQFILIKTKLATADLGGHKHTIETQMAYYTEDVKSNLDPNLTLKGLYVEYIAIGRWK